MFSTCIYNIHLGTNKSCQLTPPAPIFRPIKFNPFFILLYTHSHEYLVWPEVDILKWHFPPQSLFSPSERRRLSKVGQVWAHMQSLPVEVHSMALTLVFGAWNRREVLRMAHCFSSSNLEGAAEHRNSSKDSQPVLIHVNFVMGRMIRPVDTEKIFNIYVCFKLQFA